MNIGKGKIQIGKEALFQKTPLQQTVLKMPMIMYLLGEFVLKMSVGREKIFKKLKLEHIHRTITRIRLVVNNKFTTYLKLRC